MAKSKVHDYDWVGRRVDQVLEVDGKPSFLLDSFYEDRPGAHISVDRLWGQNPRQSQERIALEKLAKVARSHNSKHAGWAASRVKEVVSVDYMAGAAHLTNDVQDNPDHVDLEKSYFMLVLQGDSKRNKRMKANAVAMSLQTYFNNPRSNTTSFKPAPLIAPSNTPTRASCAEPFLEPASMHPNARRIAAATVVVILSVAIFAFCRALFR